MGVDVPLPPSPLAPGDLLQGHRCPPVTRPWQGAGREQAEDTPLLRGAAPGTRERQASFPRRSPVRFSNAPICSQDAEQSPPTHPSEQPSDDANFLSMA